MSGPTFMQRDGVSRKVETALVAGVAVVAALVAAIAAAAPTGTDAWDTVLKASLASAVTAAASKAPRWATIAMASAAAAFAGFTLWGLIAWIGLAIAIGSALLARRNRVAGACAGALAVNALLRLPAVLFFGFPSLIAAFACGVVLIGGYRYANKRARRLIRHSVGATVAVSSILLLLGSVALLNARSDIDSGVAAARRGLSAARSGDTSSVAEELGRAETALGSANKQASSTQAKLLRLLPIAAQHQRLIEAATSVGAQVAQDAAAAVVDADIETISLSAGSVDLAALQQMAPQLRQTANSLASASASLAEADSRWIVPPLGDRVDELTDEVNELLPEVVLAADAAEVVPSMLGLGERDTYFVIFGTPAESRELGGFVGSWALISFDNGRLQLGESGRVGELYDVASAASVTPGTVSDWFMTMARPTQFPQNLTSSPQFTQVADVSRQVLGAISDEPLSGFIYVDAPALIDMMELTGPVQTSLQEAPLTAQNAPGFFFDTQYRFDASDRTEVFDSLAEVASTVVDRMSQQTLPGPEELGRILGPAARAGHLQMATFDDAQNDFLRSVKLLRDFGRDETSDFLALIQTNGLSNKMDLYLQRELDYQAEIDEDGSVRATATATLRSVIPADVPQFALGGGEDAGRNKVLLSIYSPFFVSAVTIDGVPIDYRAASEFELGRYLATVFVEQTGVPVIVRYEMTGMMPPGDPYSLELWHQPLVNTDDVSVSVTTPKGTIEWSGPLLENEILSLEPEGAS